MENQATSIRGFQDGQFNVTFDGIPWGDSNDFTHHSTSYFVAVDIGNVVVDRGPGDAATMGDATFGGTVYVQSADPKHMMELTTNASFGSWNTNVVSVRFDTGDISERGWHARLHFCHDDVLGWLSHQRQPGAQQRVRKDRFAHQRFD
jgi:iron complex outermembrane receptor protein